MTQIKQVDVLIVGSGPAGMSTALHLVKIDPAWAKRMVVVDKAIHPREKLCGGGITGLGADALAALDRTFETPYISVNEARLVYQDFIFAFRGEPAFRVVRRDEFDHWLVQQGERQGITVCQGERVTKIILCPDYVEITTEHSTFHAKVVVAADGSRSFIRQKLKWVDGQEAAGRPATPRLARLLEILTPEKDQDQTVFQEGIAVFDFSRMAEGLQGYYWDFPSLVQGQPFMNRGIFDSRARTERPRVALKKLMRESLAQRGRDLQDYTLKGHPIYWFSRRGPFAQPHILLAGDAAGADPLLGEGISFALVYGEVAAAAIIEAFARQDFTFSTYKKKVLNHHVLSQLVWRARLARIVYSMRQEWLIKLGWRLLPLFVRMIVWFNRSIILVDPPHPIKLSPPSNKS